MSSGSSQPWSLRAAAKSSFSHSSTICTISAGASFDATEITPRPPIAITGTVIGSSPLSSRKPSGAVADDVGHLDDAARRLLDADDVRRSAPAGSPWATSMFTPVRPCTL